MGRPIRIDNTSAHHAAGDQIHGCLRRHAGHDAHAKTRASRPAKAQCGIEESVTRWLNEIIPFRNVANRKSPILVADRGKARCGRICEIVEGLLEKWEAWAHADLACSIKHVLQHFIHCADALRLKDDAAIGYTPYK